MEARIGKQNRSREEREKGEIKRKIGNKGLSPDTGQATRPVDPALHSLQKQMQVNMHLK